jgi:hypothetical protein
MKPLDDSQLAALHPDFPALSRAALDFAGHIFAALEITGSDPLSMLVIAWGHNGTASLHGRATFAARVEAADPLLAAAIKRLDLPPGSLPMLLYAADGTWRTIGSAPLSRYPGVTSPGGDA